MVLPHHSIVATPTQARREGEIPISIHLPTHAGGRPGAGTQDPLLSLPIQPNGSGRKPSPTPNAIPIPLGRKGGGGTDANPGSGEERRSPKSPSLSIQLLHRWAVGAVGERRGRGRREGRHDMPFTPLKPCLPDDDDTMGGMCPSDPLQRQWRAGSV